MSKLKSIVFNTDPKKIPEVVDLYREDLLQVKNKYLGKDPIRDAATKYLKKEGIDPDKMLSELTTRADGYLSQASEQFSEIKGRLEKAFDLPNVERLLTDIEKSELVQSVKDFDGLGQIKVIYNDVESFVSSQIDALNVAPMLEMVNSVIGKTSDMVFSFVDTVGQSTLVRGLTASLLAWKVPSLIELLISVIDDDKVRGDLWQENAIRAANMGDLAQADKYITHLGATRSRTVETELIRGMLSSYTRPADETKSVAQIGSELLAYCAKINPKWDTALDSTIDLAPYMGISNDAVAALSYTDRWSRAYAAQNLNVESFDTLFNRIYPKFAWSTI